MTARAIADIRHRLKELWWLYELVVVEGGWAYVHLPLIYATANEAELRCYTSALLRFSRGAGFRPLATQRVDDCVVRYSTDDYEPWLHDVVRFTADDDTFVPFAANEAERLAATLPASVLRFERTRLPSLKDMLAHRVNRLLARAIALNLHNAVVEADLADGLVAAELAGQTSSYLLFAEQGWRELQAIGARSQITADVVASFVENVGFLFGPDDRRANEQSLLAELGVREGSGPGPRFHPPRFTIEHALERVSAALREEKMTQTVILLTEMEEFRHYWQARFFRSWSCEHSG